MTVGIHFTAPDIVDCIGPLIFLAGPIQGAADWQEDAKRMLRARVPSVHVASPRRPQRTFGDFGTEQYAEQVDWEHRYLALAAGQGVILFWLAREFQHSCERAYAQTTRFELGEAVTLHRLGGTRVVVGIEAGYTGAKYVRHTLARKAPNIPLRETLSGTCEAAAILIEND
ncbi:MAG: hypothetical protein RLZZ324_100 [Candidatus Parcubacteria bacterium]|jgi:hypothetical protein